MAAITVNDQALIEMKLSMPRVGAWVADVYVTGDALSGAVTIAIGDSLTLKGTVRRGGTFDLMTTANIVAGNGGLNKLASPKFYQSGPTVRDVVSDLMRDAGESLSVTSDQALLSTSIDKWTTIQQPVATAIDSLLFAVSESAIFRVLNDGTIFIGTDSYPEFTEDFTLSEDYPHSENMDIGLLQPTIGPAVTVDGKKIDYVTHQVTKQSSNRTTLWYQTA